MHNYMSEKKIAQPHDLFFKQTFSRKEVVLDLLKSRLPAYIFNKIDQESFRLTNKSFVSSVGKRYESDLIFESQIKDSSRYIYFILEQQAEEDPLMLLRFLEYDVQLMRQHLSEKGNSALPAILNICIYNGKEPYKGSTNLRTIFPELDSIQEYMFQGFHLVDLYSIPDNELSSYKKAACATMVLKQGIHRDFCDWIVKQQKLFVGLEKQGYISYLHEVIWYMLAVDDHKYLLELISQFHPKLKEIAMSVAEKLRQEGQEKGKLMGIQIGEEKGKLDIAKALLSEGESLERVIRLTGISGSQLKDLMPTK